LDRIKKVRAGITGTNPDAPADRRRNGPAQRQGASRGGVARVGAGGLDSESQARQALAEQGFSQLSDVLDDGAR
jgi:hypothetical protein